jgi:tRNA pseudouridine55 synthase
MVMDIVRKTFGEYDFYAGELLLVNKPLQWTSFDVVNKIRATIKYKFGQKIKVGHAGTLDPLAEGLMIVATGKMTKQLHELTGLDKTYQGKMILGAVTPSFDLETEPQDFRDISGIYAEMINETIALFQGKLQQKPPIYSAVKQQGKALYKLARKGQKTEIRSREIEIKKFEVTQVDLPEVSFVTTCTKGTYIRSLVNDFGEKLGTGAYLSALTRTAIGHYRIKEAWNLEDFVNLIK